MNEPALNASLMCVSLASQDDEDVYILSKIADILHSFFGTHNDAFLPVFEKVMSYFVKMLVSQPC